MATVRRFLGKRGRITIPYEIRQILGLKYNDVLKFEINSTRDCIIITQEPICTDCIDFVPYDSDITFGDFFSHMSKEEILEVIATLTKELMERED